MANDKVSLVPSHNWQSITEYWEMGDRAGVASLIRLDRLQLSTDPLANT